MVITYSKMVIQGDYDKEYKMKQICKCGHEEEEHVETLTFKTKEYTREECQMKKCKCKKYKENHSQQDKWLKRGRQSGKTKMTYNHSQQVTSEKNVLNSITADTSTLSDKILPTKITESFGTENINEATDFILYQEDVKEFIKRLKEEMSGFEDPTSPHNWLLEEIDKLAGDKLT